MNNTNNQNKQTNYIPPEIHRHIFSYIPGIKEQIAWSATDTTARNNSKVTICNDTRYSHKISQDFLNGPLMTDVRELNIDHNKKVTRVNHLNALTVLSCRYSLLSDTHLSKLQINTLYFEGANNICDLNKLPHLKCVDTTIDNLDAKHSDPSCIPCCTSLTSIIIFILFFTMFGAAMITFFMQLSPQLYVANNYIEVHALLSRVPQEYMCKPLDCVHSEYPEGPLCSKVPATIFRAATDNIGQLFCRGQSTCTQIIQKKICSTTAVDLGKCYLVEYCASEIESPKCTIDQNKCSSTADYIFTDRSGNLHIITKTIGPNDRLSNSLMIYYDPEDPTKYVFSTMINNDYIANSIILTMVTICLLAASICSMIICVWSFHRIGRIYEKNYNKYQTLEVV